MRGVRDVRVERASMQDRATISAQRKKRLRGLRRYFWLATAISVIWIAVALWALIAHAASTKQTAYLQLGAAIVWGLVAWRGYLAARRYELENTE